MFAMQNTLCRSAANVFLWFVLSKKLFSLFSFQKNIALYFRNFCFIFFDFRYLYRKTKILNIFSFLFWSIEYALKKFKFQPVSFFGILYLHSLNSHYFPSGFHTNPAITSALSTARSQPPRPINISELARITSEITSHHSIFKHHSIQPMLFLCMHISVKNGHKRNGKRSIRNSCGNQITPTVKQLGSAFRIYTYSSVLYKTFR